MRRALNQSRFTEVRVTEGQIWGTLSESPYDPFDLYERGVAPHLAFANAKDIKKWHEDYGPLFDFTGAYSSSVEAFLGAQRRFVAVMGLWQAWKGGRKDIGECFVRAVKETDYVSLPGRREYKWVGGDMLFITPRTKGHKHDPRLGKLVEIDGKQPHEAAEDFSRTAPRQELRLAAEDLLKHSLAVRLEGVQPAFSDKQGFEPTWIIQDFLQACYMMLFFDMTKRRGIRNCAECGQFFYPSAKRPRCCSKECARRSRQRRYWKRRGKKLRKKRMEEDRP